MEGEYIQIRNILKHEKSPDSYFVTSKTLDSYIFYSFVIRSLLPENIFFYLNLNIASQLSDGHILGILCTKLFPKHLKRGEIFEPISMSGNSKNCESIDNLEKIVNTLKKAGLRNEDFDLNRIVAKDVCEIYRLINSIFIYGLLSDETITGSADVGRILRATENIETLLELNRENILLRWVNCHLKELYTPYIEYDNAEAIEIFKARQSAMFLHEIGAECLDYIILDKLISSTMEYPTDGTRPILFTNSIEGNEMENRITDRISRIPGLEGFSKIFTKHSSKASNLYIVASLFVESGRNERNNVEIDCSADACIRNYYYNAVDLGFRSRSLLEKIYNLEIQLSHNSKLKSHRREIEDLRELSNCIIEISRSIGDNDLVAKVKKELLIEKKYGNRKKVGFIRRIFGCY